MGKTNNLSESPSNFINTIISKDVCEGGRFFGSEIVTRFPPEPNGFLHIGHAKAILINFSVARKFEGKCNLRMDDTNPSKEDNIYVNSIIQDVSWLGFGENFKIYYASDYFSEMYEAACSLIKKGLAYVCELTPEQARIYRGDLNTPARSPFRDRKWQESLELFERMRSGEFSDGAMTLRAKIDLTSNNFNLRDPIIYRIMHQTHKKTEDKWCIYPMYDFAHPIEDLLEGVTHSLCSLEFENHKPLYEWVVESIQIGENKNFIKPRRVEFARLKLDYTVTSKRKLRKLVEMRAVEGWDDPRMPTLCGMRRRGFTPEAIKDFCAKIGVSRAVSTVEYNFLEVCLRDNLNLCATRAMAVIEPVKLIITNYPEEKNEEIQIENNPIDPSFGSHKSMFCKELFIENSDFMPQQEKGFFRLFPGSFVRLKSAYIVKCTGFEIDEKKKNSRIYCEYFPETEGGKNLEGVKVKSNIHWVSARDFVQAQIKVFEPLFTVSSPESEQDFLKFLNPNSVKIFKNCKLEKFLANADSGRNFQFLRKGYFVLDEKTKNGQMIFNMSVSLKEQKNKF
ncbi:MAG: glutamine--tRNA ligase/YqeY domain fusion protein [Oscillospiraceae bacterium]|jgi:glutaminyl-tRNA synthetase|nr:glutamine--tRNA ligase/YqeY domain fusion protein [Oscillospiraceae bacterium]